MGGYCKKVKTSQYFKRYQTKFRRRREAKTDYYARKRMVLQDINKMGSNKYRMVVRFTNMRCIAQIVYSNLDGDRVLCHADSSELKRFGLSTGFVNYSSSYATGLLLSRRLLKQIGLDKAYKGKQETDGKDYDVAALAETYSQDKKPFKAILDIGLSRSTVGNRIYACLKGACDGGIHVPHNTRNFYGAKGKTSYNADANRDRIFGCHIDAYMAKLKEDDPEKLKAQFSNWQKCIKDNGVEDVEALYEKIFAAIRSNPDRPAQKERKHTKQTLKTVGKDTFIVTKKKEYRIDRKLTNAQRKERIQAKINAFQEAME